MKKTKKKKCKKECGCKGKSKKEKSNLKPETEELLIASAFMHIHTIKKERKL